MSYLHKVFERLTKKFKVFKNLKISDVSMFSFEFENTETTENLKNPIQSQINEWDTIFIEHNGSFL